MIKVYQIQLTNKEIDLVNRGESTPRTKAYLDRSFSRHWKSENFQYYTHVANVNTNDMEASFTAMNLWEEASKVEKLGRCSSMSVGDILEMEDGKRYRCASFGFEQI